MDWSAFTDWSVIAIRILRHWDYTVSLESCCGGGWVYLSALVPCPWTIIFCPFLAVHYYLMWTPRAVFLVVVGSWGSQLSQMMHTSNTSYICWKNEALSSKLQNWIFDTIWLIFLCFKNCLFHTTHPNYKIDKNDSHAYCRAPRPVPPT